MSPLSAGRAPAMGLHPCVSLDVDGYGMTVLLHPDQNPSVSDIMCDEASYQR